MAENCPELYKAPMLISRNQWIPSEKKGKTHCFT